MRPLTFYVYPPSAESRYALIRGYGAAQWLRDHCIPAVRSPMRRGLDVRAERVPDLLARAEVAGVRVVLLGQETSR